MKIAIAALLVGSAAAFAPVSHVAFKGQALNALPGAAKSSDEDLELTREVIMGALEGEDEKDDAEDKEE